jgi:excisionase family DNA binding protein
MASVPTILITTAEAARRLGVTRERVRQLLDQGMLAGLRIEGRGRARYVDLDGEGTENDRLLLSIQEAAQHFGMSASTIRR